jgi:ABC-2 type transport system permease protein
MINLSRLWVLLLKELRQIRRNRSLVISLLVPPTIQILIFGFALNPTVDHLRLGVVDYSHSAQSRDLSDAFTANGKFVVRSTPVDDTAMTGALNRGDLDAGIVIPPDFARRRLRASEGSGAPVQLVVNAVNANTAAIAQGYAANIVAAYNTAQSSRSVSPVTADIVLLYNPGLETSWFVITGVMGTLVLFAGSIASSASTIREKETGTIEQLLMTPAEATEIIIAKIGPLFLLLMCDLVLAVAIAHTVFALPLRGNLFLVALAGAIYVFLGISIGTLIGTYTRTGLQANLLTFFVNPPLTMLSGATTPIEAMPTWVQPLTLFNPVRHFTVILRGVLIKDVGMEVLWPNFLVLLAFAVTFLFISVRRFRNQLG